MKNPINKWTIYPNRMFSKKEIKLANISESVPVPLVKKAKKYKSNQLHLTYQNYYIRNN